ncbi:MAG: hypothetical protein QNL11_03960 [Desulfobacterales bacterium]|nr:hypothetical protein [Desulfobacterales bacterium]
MPRFIKKRSKTMGASPGTLIHIGEQKTEKARISLIEHSMRMIHKGEF